VIIDAHTHIFPPDILTDRQRYLTIDSWFGECYTNPLSRAVDANDLIASMDNAGIDKSVVLGFCWNDQGLCAYHSDYIIEAVRQHPDRLIGLAIIRPADGAQAAAELRRCVDAGLKGVGELNADAQGFDLS
jgi:predicted TIM-barrel fold metal-dependent hydrolase